MSKHSTPKTARQRELARIHIRAQEIGMGLKEYRAMLCAVARVDSAGKLDAGGRAKVLDHLGAGKARYPGHPKSTSRDALIQKIEALLTVEKRPWRYAISMARRMYKKDRLEFCTAHELRGIIAALTYDRRRNARR